MQTRCNLYLFILISLFNCGFLNAQETGPNLTKEEPILADKIGRFEDGFAEVTIEGRQYELHKSGNLLLDDVTNVGYYGTITGVKDGAYGAINASGKIIAPFQYEEIRIVDEKEMAYRPEKAYCFIVATQDGKKTMIDTLGNTLLPAIYQEIEGLNKNVVKIKKGGYWGWAEQKTGKILQQPVYDDVSLSYNVSDILQVKQNDSSALVNITGKALTPMKYSNIRTIQDYHKNYFKYQDFNGKDGMMDAKGKEITPALYEDIRMGPGKNLIEVEQNKKAGFINRSGKMVVPPTFDRTTILRDYAIVYKNGLCGLMDENGKVIIPVENNKIEATNQYGMQIIDWIVSEDSRPKKKTMPSLNFIVEKKNQQALYSRNGSQLTPFHYQFLTKSTDPELGYFLVEKENKKGLIDSLGKEIVPAIYDAVYNYATYSDYSIPLYQDRLNDNRQSYFAVLIKDSIGLYNITTNQLILPISFQGISWKSDEFLTGLKGSSEILYNKNGQLMEQPGKFNSYDVVAPNRLVKTYYENYQWSSVVTDTNNTTVYENKKWEYSARKFSRLLMPDSIETDYHNSFNSGLLKIYEKGKENLFIDLNGKEVTFDTYAYVGDFYDNKAVAEKMSGDNELFGFIDKNGKEILPVIYEDIQPFKNSFLLIKKDGLKGLTDMNGKVIIPAEFKDIYEKSYLKDYFVVVKEEKYGIMDKEGKLSLSVKYDYLSPNSNGMITLKENGKFGLADGNFEIIVPAVYDEMREGYEDPFPVLVKKGEWWQYLKSDGSLINIKSKRLD